MKIETQIAQEKINEYRIRKEGKTYVLKEMLQHKEDSQRFLEFLENFWNHTTAKDSDWMTRLISPEITDLKQAIKLYNEAGI